MLSGLPSDVLDIIFDEASSIDTGYWISEEMHTGLKEHSSGVVPLSSPPPLISQILVFNFHQPA